MQLTRGLGRAALVAGLAAASASSARADAFADAPTFEGLYRWFSDSDDIAVRSYMGDYALALPHATQFTLHVNNERVVIPGVASPVGSTESVDAITTASRPITTNAYEDYVKVRNEFRGGLQRQHAGLEYYYSTETDYLGQQLAANLDRDLWNQQLNLSFGTSWGWDAIKPLADADTNTPDSKKTTLHLDAVATEVVTPTTMVRLGAEYNVVNGLQHNAYRNVYAGGTNVPERHPDHRERRDAFVKIHQALPNRSSLKAHYRLYNDDWGITSHELGTKLAQYLNRGVYTEYEYRWYTQGSASFYRDVYPTTFGVDGYLTGDYRMAALSSHLFGGSLHLDLGAMAEDHAFWRRLDVFLDYQRYFNSNNYSANILETGIDFRF